MKVTSCVFIKGIRGTDPIAYDGKTQIAFVGRSNVGKSSVINALVGKSGLVKVRSKPGRTTELNFFLLNNKEYLVDVPGYGFAHATTADLVKLRSLIVWYVSASAIEHKLIVLVVDIKAGITKFDTEMIDILKSEGHPFVIAANKVDKLSQADVSKALVTIRAAAEDGQVVACSTKSHNGMRELEKVVFA